MMRGSRKRDALPDSGSRLRWQPERRCGSVLCCDRATALRFSPSAIPKRPLKVRASIASAPSPAFYVLVAAATGMVGSLIYLQKARISPDAAFSVLDWSAYVIFIVIIGGVGTIEGPIVGVIVFYALQRYLADFGTWYLILLGALAIVTMLFANVFGDTFRRCAGIVAAACTQGKRTKHGKPQGLVSDDRKVRDTLGALGWRRGSQYRGSRVTPVEGLAHSKGAS
jgi:Branched-chain amino acid transport system / permease component